MLFFLGALAHRLSERVGVPALLLFLAIGMLAGSDGIGGRLRDHEITPCEAEGGSEAAARAGVGQQRSDGSAPHGNHTRLRNRDRASWTASLVSLVENMAVGVLTGAESGFLAVYACGIVMGNRDFLHKRVLARFQDGVGRLMRIVPFVVPGLLLFPSRILPVADAALAVSVFLMFAARPAAVFASLAGSSFSMRERALVAWTGLRGAVPVVLATFPYMAGYRRSDILFDIVFFVVVLSALLQGRTLMAVARRLGVDAPLGERPKYPIEFERTAGMDGETLEIDIPPDSAVVGSPVSGIGLPEGVLILLIRRGSEFLVPKGRIFFRRVSMSKRATAFACSIFLMGSMACASTRDAGAASSLESTGAEIDTSDPTLVVKAFNDAWDRKDIEAALVWILPGQQAEVRQTFEIDGRWWVCD